MQKLVNKILVIGQTPPPIGGQAVMIQKLIERKYSNAQLYHIRMAFSKEMSDQGQVQFFKIIHLFSIIFNIYYLRISKNIKTLYYPPSGPDKVPIYRDIIILLLTRWMFKKTIFHFHASGISEIWGSLNVIEKMFFRLAFFKADIAIALSSYVPKDGEFLLAKKCIIIPYGIEDNNSHMPVEKNNSVPIKILFVGLLKESKGEFILIEACKILQRKNIDFLVDIAGDFGSLEIKNRFFALLSNYELEQKVLYKGIIRGTEKSTVFSNADIFCFPSYFESEAFPVVLLEAMQFGLPIISTQWRGIPGMVTDADNGFLVKIKDALAVAEKLEILINDKKLRNEMGKRSREIYLQKFTINKFYDNIDKCFASLE